MNRLLLSGIAVNAGLSALMLLFTIKLSKENYGFVNAWLAGSLWGASWPYVFSLLPWAVILLPFVLIYSRRIGLLSFGQERAQSLGLDVQKSQKNPIDTRCCFSLRKRCGSWQLIFCRFVSSSFG